MPEELHEAALKTIHAGQDYLLKLRRADGSWQLPAYLGPVYICQFYLLSRWANLKTELDEKRLQESLFRRQLPDGSWYQIKDVNHLHGDLDTTITTYWALKGMGVPIEAAAMQKAREYILSHGGLDKASIFVVAIQALYGMVSWDQVPITPYISFLEFMPMNYKSFAHWAKPHMLPLAYLGRVRAQKNMGENFSLRELMIKKETRPIPSRKKVSALLDGWLIRKLLAKQGAYGSWNGYTTSTIFSLVALADFKEHASLLNREIELATLKGLKLLHTLYLNESNCAYVGISCDGTYWETILTTTALLGSGFAAEDLRAPLEYVANKQMPEGGMPYGMDFQSDPDVDDTSASVVLWSFSGKKYLKQSSKAVEWLMNRQNADGGWGAFNQNNKNNPLLNFFLRGYGEVESLFDYSSADCTGHVLEAMALHGLNQKNSPVAAKAALYLKKHQKNSGAWLGRWALNTLFGTSVSLVGLIASGEPVEENHIQKALAFLLSRQNSDGGFGETTQSYQNEALEGVGQSTPSQTAWVLMALVKANQQNSEAAENAAKYLINFFASHEKWFDPSVTATGHPGQAYMHYSVYAPAFPIIALSNFLHSRGESVTPTKTTYSGVPVFEGHPPIINAQTQL